MIIRPGTDHFSGFRMMTAKELLGWQRDAIRNAGVDPDNPAAGGYYRPLSLLNGQLYNATDVIDTYVFRSLVTNPDIGMTSAATFYQSVLCFLIIMVVNAIVKRIDEDYALF